MVFGSIVGSERYARCNIMGVSLPLFVWFCGHCVVSKSSCGTPNPFTTAKIYYTLIPSKFVPPKRVGAVAKWVRHLSVRTPKKRFTRC